MRPISIVFLFLTIWILYGGMIAIAIIFDGIYIQIVIDTAIILLSGLVGYYINRKTSKNGS